MPLTGKQLEWFERTAFQAAKVRNVSKLGGQISTPQAGFELNFSPREAHPFVAAMLKQARVQQFLGNRNSVRIIPEPDHGKQNHQLDSE